MKLKSALISILFLSACGGSSFDAYSDLNERQKVKICKNYIGDLFGRSPSIMRTGIKKDDGGFFVEIIYNRSSDNSRWNNICHINGNTIVWAAVHDGELGRWRFEDEERIRLVKRSGDSQTVKVGSRFSVNL